MRTLLGLVCTLILSLGVTALDEGHQHKLTEKEVGSVHFATSCAKTEGISFNQAVALLHSFQYEQARGAFEAIAAREPSCAMAQWGIAMSHFHGLWDNGDMPAGRTALHKAETLADKSTQTTAREKGFIAALGEIYVEDGKDKYAHAQAFEQKMGELQAANPDDSEAAIFHALSLDIAASKTDKTFSNQRKCGEILEPLFARQPHHPGIAHYLIHCYDNPVLAEKGLDAARAYAKIAPASAHANHMPSHIFTRVGSWDESIASNMKSAELAAAAEQTSKNGEARDQRLHAMDYLEYAYLQSGRVRQAKAVLDEMHSLPAIPGLTLTGDYARAAIPARLSLELGNWQEAAKLEPVKEGVPWAQAITWMAVGVGSARSGDTARASQSEAELTSLRDAATKLNNTYWSNQIEVQRREVAGWIAQQTGRSEEAASTMRSAADLEESMDKSPATPGAVVPAREMLAQLLMLQKHPEESLREYEEVLKVAPKRFNALYGAGTAADAAGDAGTASQYFRKLVDTASGDERPELATARQRAVAVSR